MADFLCGCVQAKLKAVAEGVAKGIWKQATGEDATLPPANETLVCFMWIVVLSFSACFGRLEFPHTARPWLVVSDRRHA